MARALIPALILAASSASAQPIHQRVEMTEDPQHRAVVSWSSDTTGSSTLHYDTQPHGGALAEYPNVLSCDSGTYSSASERYHHCRLTGLSPATSYYFVAKTGNDVSRELYFVTAPADGRPFKLLIGGDSRTDRDQRRIMNDAMRTLFERNPDIVALAHGGDYIENDTYAEFSEWLTDHELTIAPDGRVLPIIASRGNHEGTSSLMDEVFAEPGGAGQNWYTTVIGGYWLITLNTEASIAGDQRRFLQQQLEQARLNGACFISAQYHRPAFPGVKEPGEARTEWVPLFEQYDADLIMESDGHVLKRTVPIRNDAEDPTGVVYIGEGGLGVMQRVPETGRWYLSGPNAFAASQHHVSMLDISDTELVYRAFAPDLTLVDSLAMTSRRCTRSLEIQDPRAGSTLLAGSTVEISWITEGYIPMIELDYSIDGAWHPIASQLANLGRYAWLVPDEPTMTARVRIRSATGSPQGLSEDFSIALAEDPPAEPEPDPPMEMPLDPSPPKEPPASAPDAPSEAASTGLSGDVTGGCSCSAVRDRSGKIDPILLAMLLLVRRDQLWLKRRRPSAESRTHRP